ncbi:MAG: LETM1-related biofilm-associated protein [Lishizhenia sp.]
MLSPGSKGWIRKYFQLIEDGIITIDSIIPEGMDEKRFIHLEMSKSGLLFGYPHDRIFSNHIESDSWTNEENLKVVLFESLLHVFNLKNGFFDQGKFIKIISEFYEEHNAKSVLNVTRIFFKDSLEESIEKVIAKRIDIKKNLDNKAWINYLSNSLIYLDVILFYNFLRSNKETITNNYQNRAITVLQSITLAAHSDGEIDKKEKMLFNVFLASANLPEEERTKLEKSFKKNTLSLNDLDINLAGDWLFKQYIVSLCALTIFADNEALDQEINFLYELCNYFEIEVKDLHENIAMIERFVLENQGELVFLQNNSGYDKLYSNLSKRWVKVLGRNKDKLVQELTQSKELLLLIAKSRKEELTAEEKVKVKTQFLDIIKSMPALAIFMLPGGALLLPLVLKIIPDLVPSAFKENDIPDKS